MPFKSQTVKLDTDQSKAEYKLKKQKEQVFRNKKSSRYGFQRVFGQAGRDFFADCEDDCDCIEVIFGKGDAEMKSESSYSFDLTQTNSDINLLQKQECSLSEEVLRLDNDHEMIISVESEAPVHTVRSRGESGNLSLGSYHHSDDVDMQEPFNGYDVEQCDSQDDASIVKPTDYNKPFQLW